MNSPMAAVHVRSRDDIVIASLEGEIDLSNANGVRTQLLASIPNSASGLILDLSKTAYLDSQGVQMLLDVIELLGVRRQRTRLMVPDGALIHRVLSLTSVKKLLSIDSTMEDAVAHSLKP